jgi:hypothetical protein
LTLLNVLSQASTTEEQTRTEMTTIARLGRLLPGDAGEMVHGEVGGKSRQYRCGNPSFGTGKQSQFDCPGRTAPITSGLLPDLEAN